jgi:hypothetical protein
MVISAVVRPTPESLLRLVSLLHRHRFGVEALRLDPPAGGYQRVELALSVDPAATARVVRVLEEHLDIVSLGS